MPRVNFSAMKGTVVVNGHDYDMYLGFLPASTLDGVAIVPQFDKDKKHFKIADDLRQPPVDEWQRPLDPTKVDKIKELYDNTTKDNIMPNPILLGVNTSQIVLGRCQIRIIPQTIQVGTTTQDVSGMVNIDLMFQSGPTEKPLWILDGQHRVKGLLKSSLQHQNLIPFVLLYGDRQMYAPKDLAEIFTHVTTGATPMLPLHGEWMKYAYDLGKYSRSENQKAMQTVIDLCMNQHIDGSHNEFWNNIQFNPYTDKTAYKAFQFDMSEWVQIISRNYFGKGGVWAPPKLAEQIVRAIRTFESLDKKVGSPPPRNSKIFGENMGDTQYHKIIAEAFLKGLLSHLSNIKNQKSVADWDSFFRHPNRQFDQCDWGLWRLYSKGISVELSSSAGTRSKAIANQVMDVVFSKPTEFNGVKPSDYLAGLGAEIRVQGFKETQPGSGRSSRRDMYTSVHSVGASVAANLSSNNVSRKFLQVIPATSNCLIEHLEDRHAGIRALPVRSGKTTIIDLDNAGYSSGQSIELFLKTISYSGASRKETTLIIDY